MLQCKSNKLFEFNNYFDEKHVYVSKLASCLSIFSKNAIKKDIFPTKTKGFSNFLLFESLILLPFLRIKNISNIFSSYFLSFSINKKDSFYDFMKSPLINWRLLNYRIHFIKTITRI